MKKTDKMHFKIGSPVIGSNFFPRPDVVEELREALNQDHVLFLAPRRTGKTSILLHLAKNQQSDKTYFLINLEKFKTPEEWVTAMAKALIMDHRFHKMFCAIGTTWKKLVEQGNRVESVKVSDFEFKIREAVGKDWSRTAEEFLLRLTKTEYPVVFLLDEFPILLNRIRKNRGDVEGMLRWFRDWRQDFETDKVKFLVTGSIGLDSVVKRLGLEDTVNDFHSLSLPPLSQKNATDFMEKLSEDNDFALSTSIKQSILNLLGPPWPYFLQIFLLEIKNWQLREKKKLTIKTLQQIYSERLVSGLKNKYLPHMFGRLREIFSPDELRLARAILKECSLRPEGLSAGDFQNIHRQVSQDDTLRKEEDIGYVLDVLKHDGYLIQSIQGEQ